VKWDWNYAGDVLPALLNGLQVTIAATVLGYALALALGLVWAILRRSPNVVFNQALRWILEFIRSTPLLVQLAFLYFALLPSIGLTFSAFLTGVIGLGVHYSTYISEVYRAGIDDVPRGQWEAATALNLPRHRVWFAVVLPQAIRKVIPTLSNYLMAMFKDTPLLLAITAGEMMREVYTKAAPSGRFLEPFTMAGLLFVVVCVTASFFIKRLERRYGTY
jgi:polar amino acid transport system permease protein